MDSGSYTLQLLKMAIVQGVYTANTSAGWNCKGMSLDGITELLVIHSARIVSITAILLPK